MTNDNLPRDLGAAVNEGWMTEVEAAVLAREKYEVSIREAAAYYLRGDTDWKERVIAIAVRDHCGVMHAAYLERLQRPPTDPCYLCGEPNDWQESERDIHGARHHLCAARAARGLSTPPIPWGYDCGCHPCQLALASASPRATVTLIRPGTREWLDSERALEQQRRQERDDVDPEALYQQGYDGNE